MQLNDQFLWSNLNPLTTQEMQFSIKDFFGKCDQIRRKLKNFTEAILYEKLHFLCSDYFFVIHNPKMAQWNYIFLETFFADT